MNNSRFREFTFSQLKLFSPPLLLTPVKLFHKTIPQAQFCLSNVQSVTVLVNEAAHNSLRGPCEVFVNNKLRFSSNIPDGAWVCVQVYGSVSWECTSPSCICELFTQWIWVSIMLLSRLKTYMEGRKIITISYFCKLNTVLKTEKVCPTLGQLKLSNSKHHWLFLFSWNSI